MTRQGKGFRLEVREEITDDQLAPLAKLSNVVAIDLKNAWHLTDAGLVYVKDLKGLRELDLSETELVTDAGLQHLAGLTGLRDCPISRIKPSPLAVLAGEGVLSACP